MEHTTEQNVFQRASGEATPVAGGDFGIYPTDDEGWLIREEGYHPDREHDIESMLAVGNGRFGVRGTLAEETALSAPATYAAGLYSRSSSAANAGHAILPNWTLLRARSNHEYVTLTGGRNLRHVRTLDMRQGVQWREWLHEDAHGRVIWILGIRGAALSDPRLLFQGAALESSNFAGPFVVEAGMERNPHDGAVALEIHELPGSNQSILVARYQPGNNVAAAGEWTRIVSADGRTLPSRVVRTEKGFLREWNLQVGVGDAMRFERISSFAVTATGEPPIQAVQDALASAREVGFTALVAEHAAQWSRRWADADIEIDGDGDSQRRLRFAMYHLLSVAPVDEDVSIGARALTGPGYKGHVFWDTEIFILPFYLAVMPAAARRLLMYRYRRLDAARRRATGLGYRGALYPWESADTGEDETPDFYLSPTGSFIPIHSGSQEHHISADIAWAVARYWETTGDLDFCLHYGVEILLETARFWASRCEVGMDGRWHIRKVMGPDEFHPGVDDNAYTNYMARWNLTYAADMAEWMARTHPGPWFTLQERLAFSMTEVQAWRARAGAMADGFNPDTLLFEQFRGYFELAARRQDQELRLAPALGEEYLGSLIKQPDVNLLFQLFPGTFPEAVVRANFDYYGPRTVHGSSLSPGTEAMVAAFSGRMAKARALFELGGDIDLAANTGNASGGVHIAAMGGHWQAAVTGFAGLRVSSEGVAFHPRLLPEWRGLRFRFRWRECRVAVQLGDHGRVIEAELLEGERISLAFDNQKVELQSKAGQRTAKLSAGKRGTT